MKLPAGHRVILSIAVDGLEDRVIGTTRTMSDVPVLLRHLAEHWARLQSSMDEGPDSFDPIADWRPDYS